MRVSCVQRESTRLETIADIGNFQEYEDAGLDVLGSGKTTHGFAGECSALLCVTAREFSVDLIICSAWHCRRYERSSHEEDLKHICAAEGCECSYTEGVFPAAEAR